MIDLLKGKNNAKKRVIKTIGIKREGEDEEKISDASGIQTFGYSGRSKEIEIAGEAARESIVGRNGGDNETEDGEGEDNANGDNDQSKKIKKIDIRRYKDPEGLTLEKMEVGLWLVKYRKHMLYMLYGFLILISVFYWSKFIYVFGEYVVVGMRNDQELAGELVRKNMIGHDYFLSRAPVSLTYQPVSIIRASGGNYDLAVQLNNPNSRHWAHFDYYFEDDGGKKFAYNRGFILPGDEKYILALGQDMSDLGTNITIKLDNIRWVRVDPHEFPDWEIFKKDRLDFSVRDINFTPAQSTILTEKLNLNNLAFVVENTTPFNYWQTEFLILLFNNNRVIGTTKYVTNELMSGDIKSVNITWLGRLGSVSDIIIVPNIDITQKDIYIKFEGGGDDNYYDNESKKRY